MKKLKDWIIELYNKGNIYYLVVFELVLANLVTIIVIDTWISKISWSIVFLLCTLPVALIRFGIIKNNGLKSKLVDLSEFNFGKSAPHENFHISKERSDFLNDILSAELEKDRKARKVDVGPFDGARRLAVQYDLTANEYMLLIIKAAFIISAYNFNSHSSSFGNAGLTDRLKDIKDKLNKRKDGPQGPEDDKNKGGKYGFL